jgi:hypothetical protein
LVLQLNLIPQPQHLALKALLVLRLGKSSKLICRYSKTPIPASPVADTFTSWLRVPYRINTNEKHFRRVQFAEGQATISFTPQANHFGNMSVNDSDFAEIGGYQIKLAEPLSIDIDEI